MRFQCESQERRCFQTNNQDSLHEICNDNGVIVVHLATSKNFIAKSTMLLQHS